MNKEENNSNESDSQEVPTSNVQRPTSQYIQNNDQRLNDVQKKGK